jgi:hypothetical protein
MRGIGVAFLYGPEPRGAGRRSGVLQGQRQREKKLIPAIEVQGGFQLMREFDRFPGHTCAGRAGVAARRSVPKATVYLAPTPRR